MDNATAPEAIARPNIVIGAIVLNWNGHQDTIECLESLSRSDRGPQRIVIVDNASSDESVEQITCWATQHGVSYEVAHAGLNTPVVVGPREPVLTVLRLDTNLGFAGGNNRGLRYLESNPEITHFLLLNNDATVACDFFTELASALTRFPRAGLLTGTILEAANPERVWYAGGRINPFGALASHCREVPLSRDPIPTEFVCGCAMLISREALSTVGHLAECYFPVYVDDVEYSFRVAAAGHSVVYAPAAKVYHKVSSTVRRRCTPAFNAYCMGRHRAFFVRRNLTSWLKVAALAYLAVYNPVRAVVYMVAGQPRVGWALLRGTALGFVSRKATR